VFSTLIRASATFVPSFLIGVLFPELMNTRWMIVIGFMIFIGTEAIAWIVLFNQDLRKIAHRIRDSHQHFAAIKDNLLEIKEHIGDVAEYVVKGDNNSNNTDVTNTLNN
jgi:5-bromo-4-chloroindolyl phosphate hydrolysis protein